MRLQRYLDRIGVDKPTRPDIATLRTVHRAHALSLSYENLDVQLGRPVNRDIEIIFDKIVGRRRGGWCYEMNGLLGWALKEIGYEVTYLAGGVMRDIQGDWVIGNHLVLLIRIGTDDWIGDVGFGDGLIDPVPLRDGPIDGHPLQATIQSIGDGWRRYANDPRTGGPTFDFNPAVSDESLLEKNCQFLQTNPQSPFVQNAVVQRWKGGTHLSLRGRVLRESSLGSERRSLIHSAEEYVTTLSSAFGIDLPESASLWPAITKRHDEIFDGEDPTAG